MYLKEMDFQFYCQSLSPRTEVEKGFAFLLRNH